MLKDSMKLEDFIWLHWRMAWEFGESRPASNVIDAMTALAKWNYGGSRPDPQKFGTDAFEKAVGTLAVLHIQALCMDYVSLGNEAGYVAVFGAHIVRKYRNDPAWRPDLSPLEAGGDICTVLDPGKIRHGILLYEA